MKLADGNEMTLLSAGDFEHVASVVRNKWGNLDHKIKKGGKWQSILKMNTRNTSSCGLT